MHDNYIKTLHSVRQKPLNHPIRFSSDLLNHFFSSITLFFFIFIIIHSLENLKFHHTRHLDGERRGMIKYSKSSFSRFQVFGDDSYFVITAQKIHTYRWLILAKSGFTHLQQTHRKSNF